MANDWIGILLSNSTMTVDALKGVKRDMADLNASVAELRAAVAGVAERVATLNGPLNDALANVRAELAAERAKYTDLVSAEDAEDVEQNAALDKALDDADKAAADIDNAVAELDNVAVAPEEADDAPVVAEPEAPVVEAPAAEEPATEEVPAEETQ